MPAPLGFKEPHHDFQLSSGGDYDQFLRSSPKVAVNSHTPHFHWPS